MGRSLGDHRRRRGGFTDLSRVPGAGRPRRRGAAGTRRGARRPRGDPRQERSRLPRAVLRPTPHRRRRRPAQLPPGAAGVGVHHQRQHGRNAPLRRRVRGRRQPTTRRGESALKLRLHSRARRDPRRRGGPGLHRVVRGSPRAAAARRTTNRRRFLTDVHERNDGTAQGRDAHPREPHREHAHHGV